MCVEDAFEDVEAVAAEVRVPWIREAGAVDHLEHPHARLGVVEELLVLEFGVDVGDWEEVPWGFVGVDDG